MQNQKTKLTLEVDANLQRRLKVAAEFKGISVHEYCQKIIEMELTRDEDGGRPSPSPKKSDHELFAELRMEVFEGRKLPGDSAEMIREARQARLTEIEGCG